MVTTAKPYQAKKLLKLPKEMPSNIVSYSQITSKCLTVSFFTRSSSPMPLTQLSNSRSSNMTNLPREWPKPLLTRK